MRIGFVGLGRMGKNMVYRLLEKGHEVVAYDLSGQSVREVAGRGAEAAKSMGELAAKLPPNRKVVLIMVPAGKPVDAVLKGLAPNMARGGIIVDGGNSHYLDSKKRHGKLKRKGIHFLDMGTSGGLEGARNGASLTIGGDRSAFKKIEGLFRDLAVKNGYAYLGPSGAGHFVKIVHNGAEYALLQAYGEGFETLNESGYEVDYAKVARVWSNGSVIRSWITELAEKAFAKDPKLGKVKGRIGGGETGKWALEYAKKEGVEAGALAYALKKRRESLKKQSFATKFVSAMRKEFGGHREGKSR